MFYLLLPLIFVKFWFYEAPLGLIGFFGSLNSAFLQLFSLSLFIKTFFKPLKNEYREGLVLFSIVAGIVVKTVFIFADLLLLFLLITVEILIVLAFVAWPIAVIISFVFKIAQTAPKISVSQNSGDIHSSFTKKALTADPKKLINEASIRFILNKSNIQKKEVPFINIDKKELLNGAFMLAKEIGAKFVTTMDLFASYILLTEDQTKLLFSKKLKKEEFLEILKWARSEYQDEENPMPLRVSFWGEGIGEALVSGWTPETQKFTENFTARVIRKKPVLFGREKELNSLVEILLKDENNNVLLVGESGVGKDALVEAFTYRSFLGNLKGKANHARVFELLLGSLMAGATNKNELETRLQAIIDEVSHAGSVILFIPDFQNLIDSNSLGANVLAILMPYLKDGRIPVIATANFGSFKKNIEQNPILDVFSLIKLEPPDKRTAIPILLKKLAEIEGKNKITVTYKAATTAIEFANYYSSERVLPGSAVALIEDTVSYVLQQGISVVSEDHVIKKIEEKTKMAVSSPSPKEKELLLNLEEKLHERIIDQEEAVKGVAEAIRRMRTGINAGNKPISFLFLGPTGVGKTETGKALSSIYFGSEESMIRVDMSEYADLNGINKLLDILTDKIHDHPFSLVLLDEFEKANVSILDIFLQVFDDGRLTDNKGRTVSFVNAIIIATSNAASEFIREEILKGTPVDKAFQQELVNYLQTKGIFKPELLNRFDEIVVFKPLGEKEVSQITKLLLKKVSEKLREQDIEVMFDEKVVEKVAKEGFDQQFGARPLKRFIQNNIEDMLAQKILTGEIQRGNKVSLSTDSSNTLTIAVF